MSVGRKTALLLTGFHQLKERHEKSKGPKPDIGSHFSGLVSGIQAILFVLSGLMQIPQGGSKSYFFSKVLASRAHED